MDHFDFGRYEGCIIKNISFEQFTDMGYESIEIEFESGEVLEIYSEDLQFEHITTEGEDS